MSAYSSAYLSVPAIARRLLFVTLFVFLTVVALAQLSPSPTSADEPGPSIWLTQEEIDRLPMSGPGWDNVFRAAQKNTDNPDFSDQSHDTDVNLMAKALVYARTGDTRYRSEAIDTIMASIGTEAGATALAVARNTTATVIAADLINLSDNPSEDGQFRDWIDQLRTTDLSGRTLISTHEDRGNNWGTHAGSSRIAIDLYLGDTADLAEAARVFEGWLGNRDVYAGFKFGDLSWQCDPDKPVGINPVGCEINGHPVDGVLPDDQRRGGDFQWPPPRENYAWGGLQGAVAQAYMLSRVGYPAWDWENQAIRRAVYWLHEYANYPASGDDEWQPWLVNWAYGTSFPAPSPAGSGKLVGWTDWTHADANPPSSNQYVLSVNINGSGSVNVNPAGGIYDDGTEVTLVATADSGWTFAGWGGDLSGSINPANLLMNGDKNVTATFTFVQPSPPGGTVRYEETASGRSSDSQSVATSGALVGVPGHLYIAAVSTKPHRSVEAVSGMGLSWSMVSTMCSGRGQTGVTIWYALGAPNGDGPVTASLDSTQSAPREAVIAVSRYSGVDSGYPIGILTSANTNGYGGACSNGVDASSYSVNLSTASRNAVLYSAAAIRGRSHTPGAGYTERVEMNGVAGIAAQERYVAEPASVNADGSFDSTVDWAVIALEIRAGDSSGTTQHSLAVNTDGSGSVSLDPPGGRYDAGTSVTLTAVPGSGWQFDSWNGDLNGVDNPITIELTSDKSVTARFTPTSPEQNNLTVTKQGSGTVELNPPGGVYDDGTEVTLTAVPDSGWTFAGWGGDLGGTNSQATLTMDGDRSVTATFERSVLTQHTLSVSTSGWGAVILDPAGGAYDVGTVVTLEAIPAEGWHFAEWSGDLGGADNPATLTMDGDKDVTAIFVENGSGGGDGGASIAHEETITGGSSESNSVSTFSPLKGAEGQLYVAAISTKLYRDTLVAVESVAGLGLGWQRLEKQCSGRSQTDIEIWYALGASNGDGAVAANLTGNVRNAAIAVSRYSGVNTANPIGAIVSANTNGSGDAGCLGGKDSASYSVNLAAGTGESVVYSAVTLRRSSHTPGANFIELTEASQGDGGGTAGIAVQDKNVDPFSSVTVDGAFDKNVDWALIAFEIRAASG